MSGADPNQAAPEAALLIPVPDVEPLIGVLRSRYDPSAAVGIPAHVTINYPFASWIASPGDVLPSLRDLLDATQGFEFSLTEIRNFPSVAYLAPEPARPFIDLIRAVAERFPDSPPYEGRFDRIIPHVTVADVEDTARFGPILDDIRRSIEAGLPCSCRAQTVWLMDNRGGEWHTREIFSLRES